jgi:hypothetical protein
MRDQRACSETHRLRLGMEQGKVFCFHFVNALLKDFSHRFLRSFGMRLLLKNRVRLGIRGNSYCLQNPLLLVLSLVINEISRVAFKT